MEMIPSQMENPSVEKTNEEAIHIETVVLNAQDAKILEEMFAKIPNQMAFKIGDVAEVADVKPYVLRYWEQEFEVLKPKKAVNNQRIYSRRDVETVLMIKKYLYVDKFSIPGAIRAIKLARKRQTNGFVAPEVKSGPAPEDFKMMDEKIDQLISKVRSVKGKVLHKFLQMGL